MLSVAALYGLLAMLGWGVQVAALKSPIGRFGSVRAIILRGIVATSALAVALAILRPPLSFDARWFFLGLLIAALGYLPFLFFVYALRRGKVGVVTPVTALQIVVAALFGFLVLGETFSLAKAFAVGVIFTGVVVATVDFRNIRRSNLLSLESGVPFAVLAGLLWGIILPLFKFPSAELGALFFTLMVAGVTLLGAILQVTLEGKRVLPKASEFFKSPRHIVLIALAGLGAAFGTVFANLGYETGEISIVSGISGANIVIAAFLAALMYRERLSVREYAGAGLALLGIIVAAII